MFLYSHFGEVKFVCLSQCMKYFVGIPFIHLIPNLGTETVLKLCCFM